VALHQAYLIYKYAKHKWSVTMLISICSVVGGLIRIIGFSIDSMNWYGRIPFWAWSICLNIPIIVWIDACCLLILHWVALTENSRISAITESMKRIKPIMMGLCATSLIILLFSILNAAAISPSLTLGLYNGFIGAFLVCMMVSFLYYGRKFLLIVDHLWQATRSEGYKIFLKRITYFIFIFNAFIAILVLILILFSALSWKVQPIPYLAAHWALRTLEFNVIMLALWVISRRKPRTSNLSPTGTKENLEVPANVIVL